MSEKVKLIIEIPKKEYEAFKELIAINMGCRCSGKGIIQTCLNAVKNGIPLDSNSEKAEVQAYFDGQAYGWETGRKDLCDKISAVINTPNRGTCVSFLVDRIEEIISEYREGDSE